MQGDRREVHSIPGLGRSPGVGQDNPLLYSWRIPWILCEIFIIKKCFCSNSAGAVCATLTYLLGTGGVGERAVGGYDWQRSTDPGNSHLSGGGGCFWGSSVVKNPPCQRKRCRRHGFDPWVGKIPWRSKWQPTPIFLLGNFQGQRNLAGYSQWDHKKSEVI